MDYKEAIEELKSLKEHCFDMIDKEDKESIWIKDCEALSVAISAMQELQEYRRLGTLEEVMDMVEKQKEERPQKVLGIFGDEEYECRECGNTVEYMDEYCKWCGQKLNWSEVEE